MNFSNKLKMLIIELMHNFNFNFLLGSANDGIVEFTLYTYLQYLKVSQACIHKFKKGMCTHMQHLHSSNRKYTVNPYRCFSAQSCSICQNKVKGDRKSINASANKL